MADTVNSLRNVAESVLLTVATAVRFGLDHSSTNRVEPSTVLK